MIIAGEFGFKRVIGVELSPDLARGARANLEIVSRAFPMRPKAELIEGDAGEFIFPLGPLVIYLFHPFHPPVLRRVAAQLHRALQTGPRPVHILYLNPRYPWLLDRIPGLAREPIGDIEISNWRIAMWRERGLSSRNGTVPNP